MQINKKKISLTSLYVSNVLKFSQNLWIFWYYVSITIYEEKIVSQAYGNDNSFIDLDYTLA